MLLLIYVVTLQRLLKCKIRGVGERYIQFWAHDSGRVPFPIAL